MTSGPKIHVKKETGVDQSVVGPWHQDLWRLSRAGESLESHAKVKSEAGPSQVLPIPSVLKPVAITIPEPHKLVKNDVAE